MLVYPVGDVYSVSCYRISNDHCHPDVICRSAAATALRARLSPSHRTRVAMLDIEQAVRRHAGNTDRYCDRRRRPAESLVRRRTRRTAIRNGSSACSAALTLVGLGIRIAVRVPASHPLAQSRPGPAARHASRCIRTPTAAGPRLLRGPQHRQSRHDPERRCEPAGALSRWRRKQPDPGRNDRDCRRRCFLRQYRHLLRCSRLRRFP